MTAWYNEPDPFAAQWLRNLIAAGHIAPGIVDERPIQEIEAWELIGFTQCHFFAGIGIWSHALRRAGWPDDRPIWTGSCPCQPFSNAGKKKGFSDDRHLWPYWQQLISERKPPVVAGEQVASALEWLDLVSADLEKSGYAFGASDLCAAGFNGAHIRQRNYFVGMADSGFTAGERVSGTLPRAQARKYGARITVDGDLLVRHSNGGNISGLAHHHHHQGSQRRSESECERPAEFVVGSGSMVGGLADHYEQDRGGRGILGPGESLSAGDRVTCERSSGFRENRITDAPMLGRTPVDWLYCRDGKWRPVEPGTFPLVNEAPSRVGRLRAYGNALDAETATQFCSTIKEICDELGV